MQIALLQHARKHPYLLNNQNATNCIVAQTGANLVFISQLTKESVLRFTLNNGHKHGTMSNCRLSRTICLFLLIALLISK